MKKLIGFSLLVLASGCADIFAPMPKAKSNCTPEFAFVDTAAVSADSVLLTGKICVR
jgi:hypothetical protein